MIKITLPDGSIREFEGVVTPLEVAKSISEGLARNTISAVVNGKQVEVTNASVWKSNFNHFGILILIMCKNKDFF
jgi:hypothetical protein